MDLSKQEREILRVLEEFGPMKPDAIVQAGKGLRLATVSSYLWGLLHKGLIEDPVGNLGTKSITGLVTPIKYRITEKGIKEANDGE